MRISTELDALLKTIEDLAKTCLDEASSRYGPRAPEIRVGIADLHGAIKDALDVADFSEEETDLDMHRRAVRKFCSEWCYWSRHQEPGSHKRCISCPLAPLWVHVLARVARKALDMK